eukprot:TRINITY_DN1534_c0_g1_i2.p1 TRINITY_DN1534_c0_g1~~TRINITY_DN1534_c0_g1_i2.p1  ORF type:complete len:354 (-),score=84.54 TRINITY_DN1534_c0_g1_i2:1963-3024(-)
MPVNTSSTGATYGKSSDPLCPLGFHPQVRWPTRCKRCFRDYKEHSDSGDQKKFSNLGAKAAEDTNDPWSVRKTSFQKSRSVDVTIESGSSAATRFASYTTTAETAAPSKTEEDIPEWKKTMLERRKKDKEREEEEQKARNFGFIPGTTLHSSYVNKSYDTDSRLTTWGSASNLRSSNSYNNVNEPEEDTSSYRRTKEASTESTRGSTSSWSTSRASVEKKAEPELTPYEKYLQRKREQEKAAENDSKKREDEKKEEERKREDERKREREKKREEDRKREEEAEKERARKREKEREEKRLEEERKKKKRKRRRKRRKQSQNLHIPPNGVLKLKLIPHQNQFLKNQSQNGDQLLQ